MVCGVSWKRFFRDLKNEIKEDNVSNGAAALAYHLTLAVFPAMIFLLSIIAFLPVQNVDRAIMDLIGRVLPEQAASMFTGVVQEVTGQKKGGLLSFGLLVTLWAASNGVYAVMQQLNITYDVKEGRSFLKSRSTAIGLTLLMGVLVVSAFSLVVLGGQIQEWLAGALGWGLPLLIAFAILRWSITITALLLAFAVTYYFGPDVNQKFRFITLGSVIGTVVLIAASLGFRLYVSNFGKYEATYGSIGAVILMMLWLYISGLVILLGSEINALIEHYSASGKTKGEKSGEGQARPRAA